MPASQSIPPADDSTGRSAAESARATKLALRDQLTTARRRIPLAEVAEAGLAFADRLLQSPQLREAATVAAYVSVSHEPGTGVLLDRLREAGKRVLLPVTLPNLDLDWAAYDGPGSLAPAGFGLLEPTTPRLGVEAIGTPDVVLVPATAVSWAGFRLGQGGGCYDRALARVPIGTFTCAMVYDDELGVDVPVEPHDRPVVAAVTPTRLELLGR